MTARASSASCTIRSRTSSFRWNRSISGKVHSIDDLVRAMGKTAFTGRQVGEAADVLEAMARDEECFVVMTLAGAMTVAKQGLVIADLIDRGIVNAIVSTGALMAHGLVEATGRAHFRYNPDVPDTELYEQGYNRVYDTLEPEQNLDDVEEVMSGSWRAGTTTTSCAPTSSTTRLVRIWPSTRPTARHPEIGL